MSKRQPAATSSGPGIGGRSKRLLLRFRPVVFIVGLIWMVFLISQLLPLNQYGILPRTVDGLTGIVTSPLLHVNFSHLMANTAPLLVMLGLTVISRPKPWRTIITLTVISGAVIWLLARPVIHVGASGVIYALMGYLIVIGVRERRVVSILVAIGVGSVYGSVIVSGVLPGVPGVSWESHLIGLLAGGVVAYYSRQEARS